MNGAIARIVLRYGVGIVAGSALADQFAADKDLVLILSLGVGASIEAFYALAKRKGWAT